MYAFIVRYTVHIIRFFLFSLLYLSFPHSSLSPFSLSSLPPLLPYCTRLFIHVFLSSPPRPSQQAHQETFKQLLQHLFRLLQCRYIQEHDSDELRKDLDKCIKLLHNISKILITQIEEIISDSLYLESIAYTSTRIQATLNSPHSKRRGDYPSTWFG